MRLILLIVLVLFCFLSFGQINPCPPSILICENTAATCADGIDNDNNGMIDCEDSRCKSLGDMACSNCMNDATSFGDVVLEYLNTNPQNQNRFTDPSEARFVGDFNGVTTQGKFVSLSNGGHVKLAFTNNRLINSGDSLPDIWVFEVGLNVEDVDIELRPQNQAIVDLLVTAGIKDQDADGFWEFGRIKGGTSTLDIDAFVPSLTYGTLIFDAIKIKDRPGSEFPSGTPGADIDAVCALSNIPYEDCHNNIDDDGDGLIDLNDEECSCFIVGDLPIVIETFGCNGAVVSTNQNMNAFYQWYFNDIEILGATDYKFSIPSEQNVEGEYYAVVSQESSCSRSESIYFAYPVVDTTILYNICPGEIISLNGLIYNQGGVYSQNIINTNGCDTLLSIEITMGQNFSVKIDTSICSGDTIYINNEKYFMPGLYSQTIPTKDNCDSIINVDIFQYPEMNLHKSFLICAGDSLLFEDVFYHNAGNFSQSFVDENNCEARYDISIAINENCISCGLGSILFYKLSVLRLSNDLYKWSSTFMDSVSHGLILSQVEMDYLLAFYLLAKSNKLSVVEYETNAKELIFQKSDANHLKDYVAFKNAIMDMETRVNKKSIAFDMQEMYLEFLYFSNAITRLNVNQSISFN